MRGVYARCDHRECCCAKPGKSRKLITLIVSVSTERASLRKYQNLARGIFAEHSNVLGFKTLEAPALVCGHSGAGLASDYAVEEGFAHLLQGSGLRLQPMGDQAYRPVPECGSLQLAPTSTVGITGLEGSDIAVCQLHGRPEPGKNRALYLYQRRSNLPAVYQPPSRNGRQIRRQRLCGHQPSSPQDVQSVGK